MALEIACPGCGSKLKAPDTIAGKKVKCKKCNTSFVAPRGDPKAQPVGDSELLSATDIPAVQSPPPADSPFNFGDMLNAAVAEAPKPKSKSAAKAAALPPPKPAGKSAKSTPKAPALPAVEKFEVNDGVPDAPAPEVLSLDDDEELPAVAADAAPGALVRGKPTREEPPQRGGHHHRPRSRPRSSGKGMKILAVVGLLAVGGGIGAAVVILSKKNEPEAVKKDEPKKEDPPKDDGKDKEEATGKGNAAKDAPPALGPGMAAADPGPVGAALALPAGQTVQLKPVGAKPELFQQPASRAELDIPLPAIRRVFPTNKVEDGGVVWQSSAGFQGKGERLTLDMLRPDGKRTGRIQFDGDGSPDPVCDLSAKGEFFAHVADGKLTVWKVQEKTEKVVEALDVYADKPEHKKAGVAAVFFAADPKKLVTVSTAGAVHLWDVAGKTAAGEYVPPKATPGRVALGKNVAVTPERDSIVVAVGGAVTQVSIGAALEPRPLADLKGDVGRSLAMGTVAGKVLYAFETADKKEKAVMLVAPTGGCTFWRLPSAAGGEPVSAGWADGQLAVVGLSNGGAMWFLFEDGKFFPIGLIQTTDMGLHVAGVACHWYLTAASAPTKTLMLELPMPPDGVIDYRELSETRKTAHTFKLAPAGVSR